MVIKKQSTISDRGKRRLQIAANFLRQQGVKFDGGNFYEMVLKNINELQAAKKDELKEMVDWVEEYEIADIELYGQQRVPARFQKHKTASRKRATRSASQRKSLEGSN